MKLLLFFALQAWAGPITLPISDLNQEGALQAIQQIYDDKFSVNGGTVTGPVIYTSTVIYVNGFQIFSNGHDIIISTAGGPPGFPGSIFIKGTDGSIGFSTSSPAFPIDMITRSSPTGSEFGGVSLRVKNTAAGRPTIAYFENTISISSGQSILVASSQSAPGQIKNNTIGSIFLWDTGLPGMRLGTLDNQPLVLRADNNYVGIGTDNPSTKLHVVGDLTLGGSAQITGTAQVTGAAQLDNYLSVGSVGSFLSNILVGESYTNGVTPLSSVLTLRTVPSLPFHILSGTNTSAQSFIVSTGSIVWVGFSTAAFSSTTTFRLNVNGRAQASHFCLGGTCVSNWLDLESGTITANASQFSGTGSGTSPLALRSSSVTLQGNTFNEANRLWKLNNSSYTKITDDSGYNISLGVGLTGGGVPAVSFNDDTVHITAESDRITFTVGTNAAYMQLVETAADQSIAGTLAAVGSSTMTATAFSGSFFLGGSVAPDSKTAAQLQTRVPFRRGEIFANSSDGYQWYVASGTAAGQWAAMGRPTVGP